MTISPKSPAVSYYPSEGRTHLEKRMRLKAQGPDKAGQDAPQASLGKGEFLAEMSHEIRIALNIVAGFSELLKQTKPTPSQKDYIENINYGVMSLLSVVDNILDMSAIEARKVKIEQVDFDLDYLISSVLNTAIPQVRKKPIELKYAYPVSAPRKFKGDPGKIRQILFNLLNNALKFTPKGHISLKVSVSKPGRYPLRCRMVRIAVADTGIGIPQDKKDSIFDVFTQADASIKRRFGGSGLGLSITKKLVELLGGTISLKTRVNKGSTFLIRLPLQDASLEGLAIAPLNPVDLLGKKVIIVSFRHDLVYRLSGYFKKAGLEVAGSFAVPSKFISYLKSADSVPDIIVCNLLLAKADEEKFISLIRHDVKACSAKLIALSENALPGAAGIFQELGYDAYIPAGSDMKDIMSVIRSLLGDKRKDGGIITRHNSNEVLLKGLKVLLVQDPADARATLLMLKSFGCLAHTAANASAALKKLKQEKFDLVLMDSELPDMSGMAVVHEIRKLISKDIPIIGLTAHALKDYEQMARRAGINDFITKPVQMHIMKQVLIKGIMPCLT